MCKASVIIPTYNAAAFLPNLLDSLANQTLSHELIILDSESTDGTVQILESRGISYISIPKFNFNHGSTRNLGIQHSNYETLVFLTQDALPESQNSLEVLVNMLYSRSDVMMTYGRQLPYKTANIFSKFARLNNYPPESIYKTKSLIPSLGIKTCSGSNSFASYRKSFLNRLGGFPINTILGEDVSVAARIILDGYCVGYCGEAKVYHSHNYTIVEEFKRYFDIGVFHESQNQTLKYFRSSESEGFKYVVQELQHIYDNKMLTAIPSQLIRSITKFTAYRLGKIHNILPDYIKKQISMHSFFWGKSNS